MDLAVPLYKHREFCCDWWFRSGSCSLVPHRQTPLLQSWLKLGMHLRFRNRINCLFFVAESHVESRVKVLSNTYCA